MKIRRDFLVIGGGRLASALLGLLTIRAVTTFLSPEQYGQLALLLVIQSFFGLFLVNPVGQHINRHTHEWWDEGSLFSRFLGYKKYIFIIAVIGGLSTIVISNDFSLLEMSLIAFAMILMINGGTWNTTYIPLLNMVGKRGSAVSWALITIIIALISSILLSVLWQATATAWFIGQAIGFSIGALGASWMLRHGELPKQDYQPKALLTKEALVTYCLPLAIGTGFMWVQLSGYRLVVEHYWGLSSLGFLAVGLSLAGQIWGLVETLAQQFLYPFFYRRISMVNNSSSDKELASATLSDLLNVMMPVYLVLISITFISAPYLLKLLIDPQYAEAEIYVKLGIGIEFCRVVANLLSTAAQVTRQTRSIILPYALGALTVMVMLIVVGEQHLAISWAAVCLVIAALIMLSTMWLAMFRQVKFFPDAKVWLIAILMSMVFVLSTYWLPKTTDWFQAFMILSVVGVCGAGGLMLLLKNSSALQRLLAVKLERRAE